VLSRKAFYRASHFAIVCPITSHVRPFVSSVVLPAGLAIQGEILTSHMRSIDTMNRPIRFTGVRVGDDVLAEVRLKAAALIGIKPN
jgi:mRNA interferase MazF